MLYTLITELKSTKAFIGVLITAVLGIIAITDTAAVAAGVTYIKKFKLLILYNGKRTQNVYG